MLKLVQPSAKYKKSFIEAYQEFLDRGENKGFQNFSRYVAQTRGWAKGLGLPKGYIPATHYWLIYGNEYIGEVSIRHRLTPKLKQLGGHIGYGIRPSKRRCGYGTRLLALALLKAKRLKLKCVLVTCDEDNIGSRKIIEANGGRLQDIIKTKLNPGKRTMRWWIELGPSTARSHLPQ